VNDLPDHVVRNRAAWDEWAADYVATGRRQWAAEEPTWGIWGIPEAQAGVLPADLAETDAIELGCGTAYVSAWLARRGARPVGIDNSEAQLTSARQLQAEHGIHFPLLHGNAEQVPFPDESFDLAISEYGASIWCDPHRWIPEAARVLRPGGRLTFLCNAPLVMLCVPDEAEIVPAGERLLRPYFGMRRLEWVSDDSVGFHIPHGEMVSLLLGSGFEIEGLTEIRPSADATTGYDFVTVEWARRWPSEEIWRARKRGG